MGIQINGNTNNINAGIGSLSIEDINELDIVGVATAANFKTGTTNVHSAGIEIAGINILGADTPIGVGATIFNSGGAIFAGTSGVVTATAFHGSGANLTGISQVGGATGVDFNDNVKIRLGTSQDLEIYHDGSNSTIKDAGTGGLNLVTSRLAVNNSADNENMIQAFENGAVELYHDNSKKLETYASGVFVPDSANIAAGAAQDLKLRHDGSHSYLTNDTGDLQIQAKAGYNCLKLVTSGSGGNVELYHDNEKKLYTHANGIRVQDDSSAGAYVFITTNAGNQGSLYGTANTLGFLDGQNHYMLKGVRDGAVELYNDNTKRLETTSTGAKVTGNLSFNSAGQGIDFSASAHSSGQQSELLDDYERGSWTPSFWNAATGGTQLTNPSNTQATYVKVGRIVYLHLGVHGLQKNWAGSNTQVFVRGIPYRSYFQHNGHCVRAGYWGANDDDMNVYANLRQYDYYMEFQKGGGAQGRYEALYWSDMHWEGYGNLTCEMTYETDQGV